MSKREMQKTERRMAIIEVAKELFANRGLQQVQMQEIADAAEVGIATLFRYFPKKEHLVLAVSNSMVEEMDTRIKEIITLPLTAFEKMKEILDYYIEILEDNTMKLIRFHQSFDIFTTVTPIETDAIPTFIEPREKLAQTILQLVNQGKVDQTIRQDIDNELLIMTIIQNFSLFGIKAATIRPELKQPTSYDPHKQMQLLKQIFLSYIQPI